MTLVFAEDDLRTLRALGLHAIALADTTRPLEAEVVKAFHKFVAALEDGHFRPDFACDPTSPEMQRLQEFEQAWLDSGRTGLPWSGFSVPYDGQA